MTTTSTQTRTNSAGKVYGLDRIDGCRITNLHQSVLYHILSHLITKDAVRTSILSRDWRYNWTYSDNFGIDDCHENYYDRRIKSSLVNLVDKVLISRNLRSLRLEFYNYTDSSRMQIWISNMLRHNLEVLEVIFTGGIFFPRSLFCSNSLRKLQLRFYHENILNVVPKNCAPNLTSLYLFKVLIVNEDLNTSTVRFTFPVLETFRVSCCKWLNVKSVEIHAPLLKTFMSEPPNREKEYDYSIMIFAPRLIKFGRGLLEKFILDGSSSIISVVLYSDSDGYRELSSNVGLQIRSLLNRCTSLKNLETSYFVVKQSQLSSLSCYLDKLRRLALNKDCTAQQLFELLHLTPSLKILSLNVIQWDNYDYGTLEHVPSCIVSQLEEVEIHSFTCHTRQYKLPEFFMEKGEQLKRIGIVRYPMSGTPEEVHRILLTFPRSSPCLIIDVR